MRSGDVRSNKAGLHLWRTFVDEKSPHEAGLDFQEANRRYLSLDLPALAF
jgi:hypothetical protein